MSSDETLRWPTNLDRAGIEKRLVKVREVAEATGLKEIAFLFGGLEKMPAGLLATAVVNAITQLQYKPEHRAINAQLEMVAMNLKNLKKG